MLRTFQNGLRKISTDRMAATTKLNELFHRGVEAVTPKSLFQKCSSIKELEQSFVHNKRYHVVGFGKAVLGMAVQMEKLLGPRLHSGCISIPVGTTDRFDGNPDFRLSPNSVIEVIECAPNNLPDERALNAAKKIQSVALSMTERDVLCVLVSGGGSALLCVPKDPITLAEKLAIIKSLAASGASIDELNYVRIAISDVKGGKLAAAAKDAFRLYSYIISDIVGDPLALIASGPTIFDGKAVVKEQATKILLNYGLWNSLPVSVVNVLQETVPLEALSIPGSVFLLGNNSVALECIEQQAKCQGLRCIVLSKMVQGNVRIVSRMYVELADLVYQFKSNSISECTMKDKISSMFQTFNFPDLQQEKFVTMVIESKAENLLIIGAGETTVCVEGDGLGGRNQELALRFSYGIRRLRDIPEGVAFLSAGTDGIDGPTDVAGAIGGAFVAREYEASHPTKDGLSLAEHNDSYRFYESLAGGKYFVKTGHTGTNVMDVHLLLIETKT
ncbi:glycerate kinase [Anopheles cruzii]|uniref:glycerate kinase n=1 Tax=Anopheles cruzii TaxID=68878 RepID=UPI0022EC63F5|nr:glycerate kinase [Anopheles cruzii]